MNQEKWIAIGDIHGCPDILLELLEKCKSYPEHQLVFLGDYVDCGPDSRSVFSIMGKLPETTVFLLGNHDDELLNTWDTVKDYPESAEKFLKYKNIAREDIMWLQTKTVLKHQTDSAFFSHAGIDDTCELDDQTRHALLWSTPREELDHITPGLVIQGHSIFKKPTNFANHWFLDTGCGRGGKLSALVYPEMTILQSNSNSPVGMRPDW